MRSYLEVYALPFLTSILVAASIATSPSVSPREVESIVRKLCSIEFAGRLTLAKGQKEAADYLAEEFKKIGLQPGPSGSFIEPFEARVNSRYTKMNALTLTDPKGKDLVLEIDKDYLPLVGSVPKTLMRGDLFYVGYGLDTNDWKDYEGVDVTGKFVVVLRGAPEGMRNVTNGQKARTAKDKGATGIIFVGPSADGRSEIPRLTRLQGMADDLEMVGVGIDGKFLKPMLGIDIKTARAAKQPMSKALDWKAQIITETERNAGQSQNVIGYLPGNDSKLKDEYIVIGAHYDHLGWGEIGSRTGVEMIHFGADDNASGSAGVVAIARALAAEKANRRTIIFQLYAGEELGLVGSSSWCSQNEDKLPKISAMINMDMIGRVRQNNVYVYGVSSSEQWPTIVSSVTQQDLNLVQRPNVRGDSDQASFARKQIPVLFFHTALSAEYHTEKDTPETLNYKGLADVCMAVAKVALAVDGLERKLEWNPKAEMGNRATDRQIPPDK